MKLNIPIRIGMQGIIKATETDIRTGEKKIRVIQNTLLDDFMDTFFEKGTALAEVESDYSPIIGACEIGDSDISPSRDQEGIQGNILAEVSEGVVTKDKVIYNGIISCAKKFTFGAGVGIGTVKEVVLSVFEISGKATLTNWNKVARQIFSNPIEKNEYIQLDIEWELRINFGSGIWTGTLSNGQRDGTPVTWAASINYEQRKNIIDNSQRYLYSYPPSTLVPYYASAFYPFFNGENQRYGLPYVYIGDNNNPSVVDTDGDLELKGNIIEEFEPTINIVPYTPQTRGREFTLFLNTTETNYPIFEILFSSQSRSGGDELGFMRITFDPPLDKVNTHRLYITPKFSIT